MTNPTAGQPICRHPQDHPSHLCPIGDPDVREHPDELKYARDQEWLDGIAQAEADLAAYRAARRPAHNRPGDPLGLAPDAAAINRAVQCPDCPSAITQFVGDGPVLRRVLIQHVPTCPWLARELGAGIFLVEHRRFSS